ncbi:hypothetical protein DPMN_011696 [Dreissena polymorpha]|uniref:MAM domain-containing protein n=1 Tax=Dreissena polymorpha TaxID=45954 RepID=A0A9D4N4H3_DREPO|nr:hypothetical protein DPMN_011696 [Dreissena polymorpha]
MLLSGHYVYIETSGALRQGDVARLWTPSLTPANGACLSFWYSMYGTTMGTLNVYAVQNSSNPSLGSPLWKRTGNAGNTWIQQFINLPALSNYNVSSFSKAMLQVFVFSTFNSSV